MAALPNDAGTFNVSKTPRDLAGSGWYEILPPPSPARQLENAIGADWVIVGAGFAGLAAARRLTQLHPSERIVLLEAQRVGWGAAGRNSGFMIDLPHELNSDTYAGRHSHGQWSRGIVRFLPAAADPRIYLR